MVISYDGQSIFYPKHDVGTSGGITYAISVDGGQIWWDGAEVQGNPITGCAVSGA